MVEYNNSVKMTATTQAPSTTTTTTTTTKTATPPPPPTTTPKKHQQQPIQIQEMMTISQLESKLKTLREQSNEYNQLLTQKLASSQSGQNLLHIGTSLSSLPPDLHMMISAIHPMVSDMETFEKQQIQSTISDVLVAPTNSIHYQMKRTIFAQECAEYYQDLCTAEQTVVAHQQQKKHKQQFHKNAFSSSSEDLLLLSTRIRQQSNQQDDNHNDDRKEQDNEDHSSSSSSEDNPSENEQELLQSLDYVASLERAAHTTLNLVHDLQVSSSQISLLTTSTTTTTTTTTMTNDRQDTNAGSASASATVTSDNHNKLQQQQQQQQLQTQPDVERAQFLMKLSPRIRRLEANTIQALMLQLDATLKQFQQFREQQQQQQQSQQQSQQQQQQSQQQQQQQLQSQQQSSTQQQSQSLQPKKKVKKRNSRWERDEDLLLLMLGHIMRGLTLLGRGKEVESIFARVAIMPLIRSKVSMGRLDKGGSRGECAGLSSLLEDMISSISTIFGPVLRMSESMFYIGNNNNNTTATSTDTTVTATPADAMAMDVDLITEGVWIPIVTTFMAADTGIKMAIFSPGIANIVQANYTVLDSFLSNLPQRLLFHTTTTTTNTTTSTTKEQGGGETITETDGKGDDDDDDDDTTTTTTKNNSSPKKTNKKYYDYYYHRQNRMDYDNNYNNNSHSLNYDPMQLIIQRAQNRIYSHRKTIEFYKKWNLPIYYQLRFGECCNRLNTIIHYIQQNGWLAKPPPIVDTTTTTTTATNNSNNNINDNNTSAMTQTLLSSSKFELPFFEEFYNILCTFYKPKVYLKPLTNRFLRGTIQLIGRTISFVRDGMDGTIMFGTNSTINNKDAPSSHSLLSNPEQQLNNNINDAKPNTTTTTTTTTTTDLQLDDNNNNNNSTTSEFFASSRTAYSWGESEGDVGAVAWQLTVFKSMITSHYVDMVCQAMDQFGQTQAQPQQQQQQQQQPPPQQQQVQQQQQQIRTCIVEMLQDICDQQITPLIDRAWNDVLVRILVSKCSQPLAAVKGVAATYRMTNRPPPTQASPFVMTILKPLEDFQRDFQGKTPPSPPPPPLPTTTTTTTTVSSSSSSSSLSWKYKIITTIADRYSIAVEELLATVQRTEVALKNRKSRGMTTARMGGGLGGGSTGRMIMMTDGEKVKLQVYYDFQTFYTSAQTILETTEDITQTIPGMQKLHSLTMAEGEALLQKMKDKGTK